MNTWMSAHLCFVHEHETLLLLTTVSCTCSVIVTGRPQHIKHVALLQIHGELKSSQFYLYIKPLATMEWSKCLKVNSILKVPPPLLQVRCVISFFSEAKSNFWAFNFERLLRSTMVLNVSRSVSPHIFVDVLHNKQCPMESMVLGNLEPVPGCGLRYLHQGLSCFAA